MMGKLADFFNVHKGARRLALLWSMVLITGTVIAWFYHYAETNTAHATVIIGVIGILATVIGFYQWSRDRDDRP